MPALAPSTAVAAVGLAEGLHGLGGTLALALLSMLLAMLEQGWQSLPLTRIAQPGEGPGGRERLRRLMAETDKGETAVVVLRVASQMGLVAVLVLLAQQWVPRWWPSAGPAAPVLLACLVAFGWITLFCRVLPAELSVRVLEAIVRPTMPVVLGLGRLISPPVEVFQRLLRAAGGSTPEKQAEAYQTEILATVEEGEREGHLVEHQADMIEKVVGLRALEVRSIMTPRTDMDAIPVVCTVGQARAIVLRTGRSRYPVIDGDVDHVVGVVHVKDLLRVPQEESVRRALRQPWFVPAGKSCTELLKEFRAHRTHIAIVLDEYGGTAGLVTIEDVLEQIVGDIDDEFDLDEKPLQLSVVDERHAVAPGSLRVDELNARLSIGLPLSDDYDTLGGLIFSTLGRLPETGEVLRLDNVQLTVRKVDERRVDEVAIEILEPVS
ncbi:MAG TPA: hemolysin family protein [Planctomycetota bacterium]|nr:hemolysin family protein [Planctomycetota bacterium]